MIVAFVVGFVLGLVAAIIISGALDVYIEYRQERERRKRGGGHP